MLNDDWNSGIKTILVKIKSRIRASTDSLCVYVNVFGCMSV